MLALLVMVSATARAVGIANTVFDFSGKCSDCLDGVGIATAHLTVSGYTPGSTLTLTTGNFVSFVYDGTNLLSPYTVTTPDAVSGLLGPTFPGAYSVSISGAGLIFSSDTSGNWSISSGAGEQDFGTNGSYSATSATPEPGTAALLGLSVLSLLFLRRR